MPTSLIIVDDFLDNALERLQIGGLAQKVSDLVREPLKAISPL